MRLWLLLPALALLTACPPRSGSGGDDDDAEPVPVIQHNAVASGDENVGIDIECLADPPEGRQDEGSTLLVTLNHRAVGASDWTTTTLGSEDGRTFAGAIPGDAVTAVGLEYWLQAVWADAVGTHPPSYPDAVHTVDVSPAPLASPAPVRARYHGGDVQLSWSAPGTVTFTGYEVVAELDSGGSAVVCSGAEPDTGCTVAAAGIYDAEYATWTVTFTDDQGGTTSSSAVTDNLHLLLDVWGKDAGEQELPFGSGAGEFNLPFGVTVREGRVFVAEQTNHRLQQFTTAGVHQGFFGATAGNTPVPGAGNGEFNAPSDVQLGPDGRLYVCDFSNARIQVIDATTGAWQGEWGSLGLEEGQLRFPSGVDFDVDGDIHVAETVNARVSVFDDQGNFVDSYDSIDGEDLVEPRRIAYLADLDAMAVSDGGALRIAALGDGDDATWELLPSGSGSRVGGACVTRWGEVIVTLDGQQETAGSDGHRIVKLDAEGGELGSWGEWGDGDGQFFRPVDCAVDAEGNVYVADALNHRVVVLGP